MNVFPLECRVHPLSTSHNTLSTKDASPSCSTLPRNLFSISVRFRLQIISIRMRGNLILVPVFFAREMSYVLRMFYFCSLNWSLIVYVKWGTCCELSYSRPELGIGRRFGIFARSRHGVILSFCFHHYLWVLLSCIHIIFPHYYHHLYLITKYVIPLFLMLQLHYCYIRVPHCFMSFHFDCSMYTALCIAVSLLFFLSFYFLISYFKWSFLPTIGWVVLLVSISV